MAIKVIKRAVRQKSASIVCPTCHSVLEYQLDDVKCSTQYNEASYWIICPVCKGSIDIDWQNDFGWHISDTEGDYTNAN